MPLNSEGIQTQPPSPRLPVTGASGSPESGDARSWAEQLREIVDQLGGDAALSAHQKTLVRCAGVLALQLERLEARFATGDASAADLEIYGRAVGNLRRLLKAAGLERRAERESVHGARP